MSGYRQFCPVAKATDLLGDRWTFLIIRELLAGSRQFNDIHRGVPRMSRTLLSRRLKMLAEAGVIRRRRTPTGRVLYEPTAAGEDLRPLLMMLGSWGHRWLDGDIEDADLDPGLLMRELQRTSSREPLADRPISVRFDFADHPEFRRNLWRIAPDGGIQVLASGEDREVDLRVCAPARTLAEIWLGRISPVEAAEGGRLELKGDPELARRFSGWLGRCPYVAEQPH